MAVIEKALRLLDAVGLFIVTRFPFIELFLLLMSTGEQAENTPGARTLSFKDTLRREYVIVYVHGAIFFVCGTGMTLDLMRRKCGFAAALHLAVYSAMTLTQRKRSSSEYFIVSGKLQLILIVKPLSPSIKLQILLLCYHTFLTEVVGRSC